MKSAVAFWVLVLASLVAVALGDARLAVEIGAIALAVAGLAPDEASEANRLRAKLQRVRAWIESNCPEGAAEEAFREDPLP